MKISSDTETILINWCNDNLPAIEPLDHYNPTFEKLKEQRKQGIVQVFKGGASYWNTIFSCHAMRYYYRAWHDSLHIITRTPFTFRGELYIAKMQNVIGRQLGICEKDAKLLELDLELHIRHYYQWGKHPEYQVQMIDEYRRYGYSVLKLNDYSTTGNYATT